MPRSISPCRRGPAVLPTALPTGRELGDPFVGLTPDGLWVEALRCDGLSHLSAAKPGGRGVVYSQATRAAVERALTLVAYD